MSDCHSDCSSRLIISISTISTHCPNRTPCRAKRMSRWAGGVKG
ncbi:hypothetical protein [Moraxella lacunata]